MKPNHSSQRHKIVRKGTSLAPFFRVLSQAARRDGSGAAHLQRVCWWIANSELPPALRHEFNFAARLNFTVQEEDKARSDDQSAYARFVIGRFAEAVKLDGDCAPNSRIALMGFLGRDLPKRWPRTIRSKLGLSTSSDDDVGLR